MFITLLKWYVAPVHSYITCILPYLVVCSRMLLVFSRMYSYVLVCYWYVNTRMYSYVTRMLLVCYSYVTSMLLVCTRMLLVCYSYVLVWCFSHNSLVARVLRYFRAAQQILEPEDNDAASDPDNSGDDAQSDASEMGHFIEHSYEVLFVPDTDVECVTVRSK